LGNDKFRLLDLRLNSAGPEGAKAPPGASHSRQWGDALLRCNAKDAEMAKKVNNSKRYFHSSYDHAFEVFQQCSILL
jgi:hypothetical protein